MCRVVASTLGVLSISNIPKLRPPVLPGEMYFPVITIAVCNTAAAKTRRGHASGRNVPVRPQAVRGCLLRGAGEPLSPPPAYPTHSIFTAVIDTCVMIQSPAFDLPSLEMRFFGGSTSDSVSEEQLLELRSRVSSSGALTV